MRVHLEKAMIESAYPNVPLIIFADIIAEIEWTVIGRSIMRPLCMRIIEVQGTDTLPRTSPEDIGLRPVYYLIIGVEIMRLIRILVNLRIHIVFRLIKSYDSEPPCPDPKPVPFVEMKGIGGITGIQFRVLIEQMAARAKSDQPIIPCSEENIPVFVFSNGFYTIISYSLDFLSGFYSKSIGVVVGIEFIGLGNIIRQSTVSTYPDFAVSRAIDGIYDTLIIRR
jgi:hypothetical protein